MPEPLYKKLYAYNSDTKRHMLKSSKVYRRMYKESPQIFVDSASMFPEDTKPPIQLPLEPTPEVPSSAVHIGEPLPIAKPSLLTNAEVKDDVMRQQVRALIQAELKQNPHTQQ